MLVIVSNVKLYENQAEGRYDIVLISSIDVDPSLFFIAINCCLQYYCILFRQMPQRREENLYDVRLLLFQ